MTGLARSSAHTARDHATHPRVLVSCSLWTILSQLIIARRSSSGEGYGMPGGRATPMGNTSVLDLMDTHFDRRAYPLRDITRWTSSSKWTTLLLDSGGLCSRVVREAPRILKALEQ